MISNIEFSEAYRKFGCPSVEVRKKQGKSKNSMTEPVNSLHSQLMIVKKQAVISSTKTPGKPRKSCGGRT
jgi:hypothetical protein